jgi:serine/threonine protein kinase/tetratricopeptide (TPR) repeat protein
MTEEQRKRVHQICGDALDLPAAQRTVFVWQAAPDDAAVRDEVLQMLEEEERLASDWMELPAAFDGIRPSEGAIPEAALAAGQAVGGGSAVEPGLGSGELEGPVKLGAYEIVRRLGVGGMSEVYLARDPRLDRRVAIKLLPGPSAGDVGARERLRREARSAAALDHPFICKVFEIGEESGTVFIAMEYIAGQTLSARLIEGRLPLGEALRIAGEIAEALEEAHDRSLIHRDLKPANIMLTQQGRVKVMDFGLAKRVENTGSRDATVTGEEAQLTASGVILGTPDYMSPEQIAGTDLDIRSDLFSFGIVLCELLNGSHPFRRASPPLTMAAILHDPPSLAGDLPAGLMLVIRRLLAKSRDERYPSMREVLADLRNSSAVPAGKPEADRLPLIGRESEYRELTRRLEAAMAGSGSLVMIGGEPGIGKTHLARSLLREAALRGCFTVTGHCYEMEGAPPYAPFVEMLEYSAMVAPQWNFRYAIGESGPEVAKLMPELRRKYPDIPSPMDLPPEQQRRFLFNSYREFVERSARLTPIVAVFEDLHWADEPTLLLLTHLAQTVAASPILMIGSYRDVELDVNRSFAKTLEELIRQKLASRIPLRRLPVAGVEAMLHALSGNSPPSLFAKAVFEETEGNPFFVEEVFRHLKEEGKLFDDSGAWRPGLRVVQLQVPEGVRLVIGRRLERLSESARRVLTTAAVVGRSFDLALLEDLENARPDAALDAVEEAERAQLVTTESVGREVRYRFVHELIRQTLAEALSLPRRQRLHRRIADAIEGRFQANVGAYASAIAHHLYQAGAAAEAPRTARYLRMAAAMASSSAAHEEALTQLDRALAVLEEDPNVPTADLVYARAKALRSLSRFDEAVGEYERAMKLFAECGNAVALAVAALELAYIHGWNAQYERADAVIARALASLGTEQSLLRNRLLFMKAASYSGSGRVEEALAAIKQGHEAIALVPELADDVVCIAMEARAQSEAGRFDRTEDLCRKGTAAFRAEGNVWGEADLAHIFAFVHWNAGRVEETEEVLRASIGPAERVGHRNAAWACQSMLHFIALARGDLEGAEQLVREAWATGRGFPGAWVYLDDLNLGEILFLRGKTDESLGHLRAAARSEPHSHWARISEAALFRALAVLEDPEAHRMPFPRSRGEMRIPTLGRSASLAKEIEGLAWMGRRGEAGTLHEAAEQVIASGLRASNFEVYRTTAGIAAGCVGNFTRAEEHFQIAIEQCATYRQAEPAACYWYGDMLLARGTAEDRDRARQLFERSLRCCESLGMPIHAGRARQVLADNPQPI